MIPGIKPDLIALLPDLHDEIIEAEPPHAFIALFEGVAVKEVDRTVKVRADHMERPVLKPKRHEGCLDVFGPFLTVSLMADDAHERRREIDDQGVFPGFFTRCDRVPEMVDQGEKGIIPV